MTTPTRGNALTELRHRDSPVPSRLRRCPRKGWTHA